MNITLKDVLNENIEDGWDYSDDELASIYGGDTGYDYEEEPEVDSPSNRLLSPAEKELVNLGVDLERAEKDGAHSYFNANISIDTLKKNGYKYIHTNSDDPTSTAYTNGTWVINLVACTGGFVSIYKLGPKAKETIDDGKEFDVFNNALDESYEEPIPYTMVEYTYNGDDVSDYVGHIRVRTDNPDKALRSARKYAISKHPEDAPRHFRISTDTYTNVDVVDSDGDYLTTLEEAVKKPKYWDTTFRVNVVKAYEAGELTLDNIEEWETKYNGGIKPNPSLGARDILTYYINNASALNESKSAGEDVIKQCSEEDWEIVRYTPEAQAKKEGYGCVEQYLEESGFSCTPKYFYIARLISDPYVESAIIGIQDDADTFSYYGLRSDTEDCTKEEMFKALTISL